MDKHAHCTFNSASVLLSQGLSAVIVKIWKMLNIAFIPTFLFEVVCYMYKTFFSMIANKNCKQRILK